MLIRFIFENFLSFNEKTELSLIPGSKGRLLKNHIVDKKKWNDFDVLRTAIIYGANASGKSNLIKAMSAAKEMISKGTKQGESLPIKRFKLFQENSKKPSKFQFDFKMGGKVYSYGFVADTNRIHSEWLFEITKYKNSVLFERKLGQGNTSEITFGNDVAKDTKERQFLEFVSRGTRPNQLFLPESVQRNVGYFVPAHKWFSSMLTFIFPETEAKGIEFQIGNNEKITEAYNQLLKEFDTGISGLTTKKINLETDSCAIPEQIIADLRKRMGRNERVVISSSKHERYLIYRAQKEELMALELICEHNMKDAIQKINFELHEESDGTRRIIDLLPALSDLLASDRVFIIDEIDRSLHPNLTRKFLDLFLNSTGKQFSQLIVTTHEASLLDLKLLRKDEIWFVENKQPEGSRLYSLEEFKPRFDKDIRRGYLLGRFGAIPCFR